MIYFLGLQALVFAGWSILSLSVLLGIVRRSVGAEREPDLAQAARAYMTDPFTRFRRLVWVGATGLLVVCLAVSATFYVTY